MVKCNVILENSPHPYDLNFKHEHGLALHLIFTLGQFLFDFGQTEVCLKNSEKMGLDIGKSDFAILSHGHYDHAGGLKRFSERYPQIPVYANDEALREGYISLRKSGYEPVDIYSCSDGKCRDTTRVTKKGCHEIFPGVYTISTIEQEHELPKANGALFIKTDQGIFPDRFEHELVAVIYEKDGLVVLSGCSHNGILNILETVRFHFPEKKIKGVIGGFHLPDMEKPQFMETDQELKNLATKLLCFEDTVFYTGHCTGKRAYTKLKAIMGKHLLPLYSGMTFEL